MSSDIDRETLKLITEAAARAAGEQIARELREDLREQTDQLNTALRDQFKAHFGTMDPSKHVIAHDRMDRLLRLLDKLGENVFGKILQNMILGMIVIGIIGYAFWLKLSGGQ